MSHYDWSMQIYTRTRAFLVASILLVLLVQYLGGALFYAKNKSLRLPVTTEFRGYFSQRSASGIVATESHKPVCPIIPPDLKGRYMINTDSVNITQQQSHLLPGGRYKPANCTARHRVAIIIPYRDRELHLRILLQNLHPFLQRQQLDYGIYIIELEPSVKFNRAALMNIGFVEASKLYDYQCFIFHDVDLVPEDDRNLYTCPQLPRHMSAAIDKYHYRPKYKFAFGGVTAIKKDHFIKTNGFSNMYFGWGYEDDDFYRRVLDSNLTAIRYSNQIGRYKMLDHTKEKPNPYRHSLQKSVEERRHKDGLNTLKYEVLKKENTQLYTWIYVIINKTELMMGEDVQPGPDHMNLPSSLHLTHQPPDQTSGRKYKQHLQRLQADDRAERKVNLNKYMPKGRKLRVPETVSWLPIKFK